MEKNGVANHTRIGYPVHVSSTSIEMDYKNDLHHEK